MTDGVRRRGRWMARRATLGMLAGAASWLAVAWRAPDEATAATSGVADASPRIAQSTMATPARIRSPSEAGFAIRFKGETSRYRMGMLTVLPGGTEKLSVVGPIEGRSFAIRTSAGRARAVGPAAWEWQAPQTSGTFSLSIVEPETGDSIRLVAFVLVPLDQVRDGWLNGYRIGQYPARALRGLSVYERPRGFIEVTPENADVEISPHFRLRQFLCKQEGGYPKYVVLHERLLLKLEYLLQRVNEAGHDASTFNVLSGYRTPFYNAAIGNVRYSGHVYGLAADIFVDERPSDGMMDDLNGDGRHDVRDAQVLYNLVDRQVGRASYESLLGGLGRYRKTSTHGPFIHVDVRGFRARW